MHLCDACETELIPKDYLYCDVCENKIQEAIDEYNRIEKEMLSNQPQK